MTIPIRAARAVLLAACLLAPACISVGPSETVPLTYYTITLPEPPRAEGALDAALVIRPFAEGSTLDREEILYRTSDVTAGYFGDHLWAQNVSDMVREAVQSDLEAWGGFREVLLMDNAGRADFCLAGEIHRFEEVDSEDGWKAVVEITFEATRENDGAVVYHRRHRAEEPSAKDSVAEVVRALGRATGRILADLRSDLGTAVRERSR